MMRSISLVFFLIPVCNLLAVEDDFLDGVWDDGVPIQWNLGGGEATVVDGDLVLKPSAEGELAIMSANVDAVSIRAQFRIRDGIAGLWLPEFSEAVWIDQGGTLTTQSEQSLSTSLRPSQEDVVMQIDAIGERLDVWAWEAGMPPATDEPLLQLQTRSFASATQGDIWTRFNSNGTTFRYVQLSDSHLPVVVVPEPNAFGMGLVATATATLLACSRRKRPQRM